MLFNVSELSKPLGFTIFASSQTQRIIFHSPIIWFCVLKSLKWAFELSFKPKFHRENSKLLPAILLLETNKI